MAPGFDFDRLIDRRPTASNKWRKFDKDVLPLWVADMDFASPEPVVPALRERAEHGVYGYVFEEPEFFEVVADRIQKRYGWRVGPEAVVLLPGVIAGLNMAARVFAAPGDSLLEQVPVYPAHPALPEQYRPHPGRGPAGAPRRRPLRGGLGGVRARHPRPHPRLHPLQPAQPHRPRLHPRGADPDGGDLRAARPLRSSPTRSTATSSTRGSGTMPIASLAPEVAARTITLMSPSRPSTSPASSVAIAVVPDAALREKFLATKVDLVANPNVFGFAAALAAYRDGGPWLDALLTYLEANRDYTMKYVRENFPGVVVYPPEGMYLAWLDFRSAGIPGNDPYTLFLEKARVALNDGPTFGPGGQGFARLNFGCPRAMLTEGLDRMRDAFRAYRAENVRAPGSVAELRRAC